MSKINEYCAGGEVGTRFLLGCALCGEAAAEPSRQTLRFDATVDALVCLREWLKEQRVTHVVMESTGSYWIPVFNILEDHFTVVPANPEEVKTRKGHKTDRKDAEHLAELLRHNHVRASYIPPKAVRSLRDLTRRAPATDARRDAVAESGGEDSGAGDRQNRGCPKRRFRSNRHTVGTLCHLSRALEPGRSGLWPCDLRTLRFPADCPTAERDRPLASPHLRRRSGRIPAI